MTIREAINLLEEVRVLDDSIYAYNKAYSDALEMALTALDAEEAYPYKEQWIPVTQEEVFQAGYEGREIQFRVNGRLFAIRELAQ